MQTALPSINLTLDQSYFRINIWPLFAVSKALDWVAWNPTRWFWVGPTAGGRARARLGGFSSTPFAILPPLKWLYWCPRAFNATPTPATKSAATLTFGGLCTTVAFWCCCPFCWNSTAHGRIANFGYLAWPSPRIIPFRWKRISILSSTIWGKFSKSLHRRKIKKVETSFSFVWVVCYYAHETRKVEKWSSALQMEVVVHSVWKYRKSLIQHCERSELRLH